MMRKTMKWYKACGQYGPQGFDYVERYILCRDVDRAYIIFDKWVYDNFGEIIHGRMGERNIVISEL